MLEYNLKIAWRNLWKSKLYSAINIFGLSLGLGACLLIGLYISNELQYDAFHEKGEDIYRVTMEYNHSGTINSAASTGTKPGPEFKRSFPEVKSYVRTYIRPDVIYVDNNPFEEDRVLFADPDFFKVFSFNLLSGEAGNALDAPDKIVLSSSLAKKYFGELNPMGKTLKMRNTDYRVSGIFEDTPQNSQLKFDIVTQFTNISTSVKNEIWWTANWITYLLLDQNVDNSILESKINSFMDSPNVREQTGMESPNYLHYKLEPLKSVHLYSKLPGFEPNGNIRYIYIFGLIGLFILIIASANYTNLAMAQSMGRGSEIGTKKVMGASRKQIFTQFISESILITLFASIIALIFAILFLPYFNRISGKSFVISDVLGIETVSLILVFGLLVGLLSGLYPALILARTRILNVLKSSRSIPTSSHEYLRKTLIVVQFSISIFLIAFTSIVISQVNFLKKANLGYDREHVVVLPINRGILEKFDLIKEAFQNVTGVINVTASYETPEFVEWGDGITVTGKNGEQDISLNAMPTDFDFAATMGIKFAAGRDFIESDLAMKDTTNSRENYRQPYIINETLAEMIGWTPEEAIGKTLENRAPGPIVGVMKDFNFSSLHEPVGPLLQFLERDFSRVFMLKINGEDIQGTLARLNKVWNERIPERPFSYHFLDEDYNKLYASEERFSALFQVSGIIAITLATLGLFGLAAFVIVKRTKEIGIRRVLGANIPSLTILISNQFLKLVLLAILIATPLALAAGRAWLQDFSYRIEIGTWHFIISALLVLAVAFLTISFHTVKACFNNPVNSLRNE